MEANKIQVIDDQGNELEYEVLFTFNNDELNKQYVLYYDSSLEEPNVYASKFMMMKESYFQLKLLKNGKWLKKFFKVLWLKVKRVMNAVVDIKTVDVATKTMKIMNVVEDIMMMITNVAKKMVIDVVKIISHFKVWNDVKSILFIIIELFSNKNIIRNV